MAGMDELEVITNDSVLLAFHGPPMGSATKEDHDRTDTITDLGEWKGKAHNNRMPAMLTSNEQLLKRIGLLVPTGKEAPN